MGVEMRILKIWVSTSVIGRLYPETHWKFGVGKMWLLGTRDTITLLLMNKLSPKATEESYSAYAPRTPLVQFQQNKWANENELYILIYLVDNSQGLTIWGN